MKDNTEILSRLTPILIEAREAGWDLTMQINGANSLSLSLTLPEPRRPTVAEIAKTLGVPIPQSAGGHARAAALSPERRRQIAQVAAETRWSAR